MQKVNNNYTRHWWTLYKNHVHEVILYNDSDDAKKVDYWRNTVFCKIITYLTPLSVIALVPSVIMSFMHGVPVVGYIDLVTFIIVVIIAVVPGIKLEVRKAIFIFIFYFLSIILLYFLPLPSPGLLFLLTITIFSSLIYSSSAAYFSAWANTLICIGFALLFYFDIKSPFFVEYNFGAWIAVSSNLVFVSFTSAKCLDLLLVGLSKALKNNKTSEAKLEKANRLYQLISQINQAIVHVKDAKTLFSKACNIATEYGQYKKAWISTFDREHQKIILVDSCGICPDEIKSFIDVPYETNGSMDFVLKTGNYFLCNDIEQEHEIVSWKPFAEKHNIGSCIILPIKRGGEIFGTLNLYATESNYFDQDDITSLMEVTGDISFALDHFDKAERHKEAEEIILKNEKRFRALIEDGSDMITLTTLEGKIIYGSPSVPKLFGYTLEEILNTSAYDLIHPDDITELVHEIRSVLEIPGKSFLNQHRILHKNGEWIWCEGTFTNLLHEPGIEALVSNFRDISEKKEAEIKLQQNLIELEALSKEQSTILNTLPASIALLDQDGTIVKLNDEWINFGLSNGMPNTYQQLGKNYIEISERSIGREAKNGKQMSKGLQEVLRGEREYFTMEYQCDSVTEKRWFKAEVRPFKTNNHTGAVVMHINISERKKAEAEMLLLINNTEESFLLLNNNLQIVSFNAQFKNLYEKYFKLNVQKGHYILDYTLPERREYVASIYKKVLGGNVEESELTFQDANNSTLYFCLKYNPAKDESGNIFGVFVTASDITEKRTAEVQKEFERRNKEALINSTDDLIWSVSKDFKLIAANNSFIEELRKYTHVEIQQGDDLFKHDIYPAEYLNYWRDLYTRAFTGESFKVEIFTPSGEKRDESWTETSFSPIFINNQLFGVACYSRNITERKKIELELRASETRLAEAQSLAKMGHWETELLTDNMYWSEQTYQLFDCPPNDFKTIHQDFLDYVHPDDRKKVDAAFKNSFDTTTVNLLEHRIISQKGDVKFLEERWQIIRDKQGVPVKAVGTCQDITDRKKSDHENKFKAELLDTIGQAVIATDLDGKVTFWNKAAVEIYGWTYEEAYGTDIIELTPSIQTKEEGEIIMKKLAKGETWSGEFYMKRKSGSYFPAFVYNSPVFDEFGKQIGIIGVSNDISERKEYELERAKITSDLLQRNRDLEQFTFIISHNLRAPTANIIGFTEILKDETLTQPEQKELLYGLSSSVAGLDSIIKDINSILQVNRAINEKKEIIFFTKLVDDIMSNLEHLLYKQKVQLKIDFKEVDQFFSLKVYMHSIFYNLISNSIKYSMADVQTVIEISSKIEKGKVILVFKDNGLGFDMTTKGNKVFGLYKRFHSHVEGKGVGLFMVKTQVEAIGGIITVASEVNKGTEFTIVFDN
ncbi:MAG TPA: PAS domain S-box protein [Flavobacterium sp.]|uniref:PAS domain S-box protein n=3 Tax=Flavobacterium TaxID=237 RepID=UPI0025C42B5A|nr:MULTISPECIES: PAS domain S-box protein [unclassified Flavobacterium]HRE77361.1 PAS domain S-box protein [Flavobacterium sp.]